QARGTAILLEPETEAESITGVDADTWIDERIDKLEQLSSNENHAALKSLIGSGYALDLDRAYERGLALMLSGSISRLKRTRSASNEVTIRSRSMTLCGSERIRRSVLSGRNRIPGRVQERSQCRPLRFAPPVRHRRCIG